MINPIIAQFQILSIIFLYRNQILLIATLTSGIVAHTAATPASRHFCRYSGVLLPSAPTKAILFITTTLNQRTKNHRCADSPFAKRQSCTAHKSRNYLLLFFAISRTLCLIMALTSSMLRFLSASSPYVTVITFPPSAVLRTEACILF